MSDVDFDDVQGDDPVGEFDTRTLQDGGRVSIPSEYLNAIGMEVGDNIFVACKEDGIVIKEASIDTLKDGDV